MLLRHKPWRRSMRNFENLTGRDATGRHDSWQPVASRPLKFLPGILLEPILSNFLYSCAHPPSICAFYFKIVIYRLSMRSSSMCLSSIRINKFDFSLLNLHVFDFCFCLFLSFAAPIFPSQFALSGRFSKQDIVKLVKHDANTLQYHLSILYKKHADKR